MEHDRTENLFSIMDRTEFRLSHNLIAPWKFNNSQQPKDSDTK